MARDAIWIEALRIDCVIGVYPQERMSEQPVTIDLRLLGDLSAPAHSCDLNDTCDYDRLAEEVGHLMRFRGYQLLETAAEELCAMIFGLHGWVQGIDLCIRKPQALRGRAKAACIQVQRSRADFPVVRERSKFGTVDVLYESKGAGLYLLHVDAGASIPAHYHAKMDELEWLVDGELLRDGKPLVAPGAVRWPKGQVHGYQNQSRKRATLFCCDKPPFIPEDEIEVASP